jgi:lipoprotein-anchoring transpeptidase ErfK/SrfK
MGVERCCDRFGGWIEPALLLSILAASACVERTRDAPKPRPAVPARAAAQPPPSPPPPTPAPRVPSGPPVRLFAKRFVANVRQDRIKDAARIGYLRGGAVVQATSADPLGFDDCKKGWYALDTGGFVCSTLDATPFTGESLPERQPLQPDMTAALPYPYGYNHKPNAPMFRRLPTDQEAAQYASGRVPRRPRTRSPNAADAPPAPSHTAVPKNAPPLPAALLAPLRKLRDQDANGPQSSIPTLASLMGDQSSVLMRQMERGFYVSLDREMPKGTRNYWHTQSGGFVASDALTLVHGSDFQGTDLRAQSIALPVAFVMSKDANAYKLNARGQLVRAGQPGYRSMFAIASESDVRGTHYDLDADGTHYREKDVRRIEAREKPPEVADDEKWIDVDLGTQSLVAYIGAQPVYATLISSGRVRDVLDPLKNFETPTGSFRVQSKHLTATMDGDLVADGPYSIEDVPYVMYFQLAYALHSAFWHDSFGRPHSHGCVNLAPRDAKWLFEFAEPRLPAGWHGVLPQPQQPGTRVYVHGATPLG